MPWASASFSRAAVSPRTGSTASPDSHGESHFAIWNPVSRNTRSAASSSFSSAAPRMISATSERLLQADRQALRDAQPGDLVDGRFADRLHRTEVSQERTLSRRSDSFDGVERRRQRLARADLAMVRDGEAMRLVPNSLDEEHAGRVPLLDDGLGATRSEDLLALLGERERRDVGETGGFELLESRAQLAPSAVDEDQVGPARERAVADDIGVLTPLCRLEAFQAAPQHLLQHREVVRPGNVADLEMAIVVVPRTSVFEDDHRTDGRVALDVRDVVALDALRR